MDVTSLHDTGRTPRLRADAARNRARLLAAADELLARGGGAVPLDDIARHAGLGPGTLHRHFPTKAALVAAVVAERLRRRTEEAAADAGPPGAVLRTLLERLLDDGLANRALKELLQREAEPLGDPAAVAAFHDLLTRLVRAGQRDGTLAPELEPGDVLAILAGALVAQAHVRPERVKSVRARLLAALDPA